MKKQLLLCLVMLLGSVPAVADLVIQENFDDYVVAGQSLTGKGPWIAARQPGLASYGLMGWTDHTVYAVGDPTYGECANVMELGQTYSTGTVSVSVNMMVGISGCRAYAEFWEGADTNYAKTYVNLTSAGDVSVAITTIYGDPQFTQALGTQSELLGHWFKYDILLDLDAKTIALTITDLDQDYVTTSLGFDGSETFAPRSTGSFTTNAFGLYSYGGNSANFYMVPEPTTMGMLAIGASAILVRRKARA